MAVYYYNARIVSCRDGGNPNITGLKTNTVSGRAVLEHAFTSTDTTAALSKAEFLASFDTALQTAPEHIKLIKKSGTGSANAALSISATSTNDGNAASGPWSERVGKDIFRYEIGVSTTNAATAITNRTAHNLA